METTLTPTALAPIIGTSVPYASQILTGKRPWTQPLAIRLFRATGQKVGPIAGASDDEIGVIERFLPGAAA